MPYGKWHYPHTCATAAATGAVTAWQRSSGDRLLQGLGAAGGHRTVITAQQTRPRSRLRLRTAQYCLPAGASQSAPRGGAQPGVPLLCQVRVAVEEEIRTRRSILRQLLQTSNCDHSFADSLSCAAAQGENRSIMPHKFSKQEDFELALFERIQSAHWHEVREAPLHPNHALRGEIHG